jgi:Protein of unknown function (DUF3626)
MVVPSPSSPTWLYPQAHSAPSFLTHRETEPGRHRGPAGALVLDPCFRDTDVQQWAEQLPCPLEWHHGFRLSVDELQKHPDYRGTRYIELGISLAQDGYLDPKMLGDASGAGAHDDQALKRLWHYIARFGSPADAIPAPSKPAAHPGPDPSDWSKWQDDR